MRIPRLLLALGAAVVSGIVTAQVAAPPGGMGPMGALMRADANNDGIITREEVIASSDRMFDRLDTDHDGTLSADELAAGRPMRDHRDAPPPPPPSPTAAAPAGQAPSAGMMPPPPAGRPMPRSFTRQQWRDRALAQFDRVDANHDGKVDQTEMQAFRATMRARRGDRPGGDAPPPPPPPSGQ